ncbi:MAG: hypothetical protein IKY83_01150 [Proteobacteria bacterium]|nr:hypothetical protein [Pseudomonadota bacterium]
MQNLKQTGLWIAALATLSLTAACGNDAGETPTKNECKPACDEGQECDNGECKPVQDEPTDPVTPECPENQTLCGTTCRDLTKENEHCGECDNACTDGRQCVDSKCDFICDDRNPDKCDNGCFNFKTDIENCGSCGNKCSDTQICLDSVCTISCDVGLTPCGETCVNLQTDDKNCGACNNDCTADQKTCQNGECKTECPAGQELCGDGQCYDLSSDKSCGTCDNHPACDAEKGEFCSQNRECEVACPDESYELCNGKCINYQTDKENCGGCGESHQCATGLKCSEGQCKQDCGEGLVDCNGRCVDPTTDKEFCGADLLCQNFQSCGDGLSCQEGECKCTDALLEQCQIAAGDFLCTDAKSDSTYCGCSLDEQTGAGMNCETLSGISEGKCVEGICQITCDETHRDCNEKLEDGCEADLTSIEHCGGCNLLCQDENASDAQCVDGECRFTCKEGMASCGGNCINIKEDDENCGYCGNKCEGNAQCINGFCTIDSDMCDDNDFTQVTVNGQTVSAYCIKTENEFKNFRNAINRGEKYSGEGVPGSNNADNAYIIMDNLVIESNAWDPIGNSSNPFKGYIFGNGKLITAKLTLSGSNAGLFGFIQDSYIRGLNLDLDCTYTNTGSNRGGFVGTLFTSTMEATKYKSKVISENTPRNQYEYLGGLIGFMAAATVSKAQGEAEMRFSSRGLIGGTIGGIMTSTARESLVEFVDVNATITTTPSKGFFQSVGCMLGITECSNSADHKIIKIENSHSSGLIDLSGQEGGMGIAGGLIGELYPGVSITDCSSSADLKGAPGMEKFGGLLGWAFDGYENFSMFNKVQENVLKNSHATGNITECYNRCGGLIGHTEFLELSDSYATGSIEHVNAKTNDSAEVGGLIGRQYGGTTTNCYATGAVSGNRNNMGGLIGTMISGKLSNSHASGNVSSERANIGGLIGYETQSEITNVYAEGSVSGTTKDAVRIGGLVGQPDGTYTKVYAKGDVSGWNEVGGIFGGNNGGSLTTCAAFGNVNTIEDSGTAVGGIGGRCDNRIAITNCSAYGDVKGQSAIGAACGKTGDSGTAMRNIFAAGMTSGTSETGAFAGRIGTSSLNAGAANVSFLNAYYWTKPELEPVGAGTPAVTDFYAFQYNESKEAVLTINAGRKVADNLGKEWIATTCDLKSGPNETVVIPVPKALGADICK